MTTAMVSETGNEDVFTVVLTAEPASNVVLDASSASSGEVTVSPAQLTFTSANWNTPQTVTVTGVDDSPPTVDGDQAVNVTLAINDALSDHAWHSLTDQIVSVTNQDNDNPGFTLSKAAATVSENETFDTFTIVLTAQPLSDVVFDLTSGNTPEVTVFPAKRTFTPINWNVAQAVTVTGVDDSPPMVRRQPSQLGDRRRQRRLLRRCLGSAG